MNHLPAERLRQKELVSWLNPRRRALLPAAYPPNLTEMAFFQTPDLWGANDQPEASISPLQALGEIVSVFSLLE